MSTLRRDIRSLDRSAVKWMPAYAGMTKSGGGGLCFPSAARFQHQVERRGGGAAEMAEASAVDDDFA